MNRWVIATLSAFALLIAVSAGVIAVGFYHGMQTSMYNGLHTMNVAEAECTRAAGPVRTDKAYWTRYTRCMKSKGIIVTTTVTRRYRGTPEPAGFSVSTKFVVKPVTVQNSSGATSRHT